jgi:glycosyltransferase involved in cell wall biosynthesis
VSDGPRILYVGGRLPARSETFVYREVFALRERGLDVVTASVHGPEQDLGEARLDDLAREGLPVYGTGAARMLADAARETLARPIRAAATLALGGADAIGAGDVPLAGRPKVLWQCLAGLALARRARGLGIDHVHAHMAHVPATIAMYAARQLGARFSMTPHAVDIFRDRALLARKLRRAAFVCCISRWHRDVYRGITARDDDAYPIVRCGVDVAAFREDGEQGGDISILAVGRLVPKKGFDTLVEAVAALADGRDGITCDVAGDGPEAARLRDLAASLGVAQRVTMHGARDNAWVRQRMGRGGVFALPCRIDRDGDRDGIPVVLMEAMASGCSVVAGDLPSIRELVIPDETGLIVPSDDPAALRDAIERLLDDGNLRDRLASAARSHVAAEFSLDVNADRLLEVFHRAAGARTSAAAPTEESAAAAGGSR